MSRVNLKSGIDETICDFHLPAHDGRLVSGSFSYSNTKARIILNGSLGSAPIFSDDEEGSNHLETVYGKTIDGKKLTLFECSLVEQTNRFGNDHPQVTQKYSPKYVVYGDWYENQTSIIKCSFRVPGIESWFPDWHVADSSNFYSQKDTSSYRNLKVSRGETVEGRIDSIAAKVEFAQLITLVESRQTRTEVHAQGWVNFYFEEQTSIADIMRLKRNLEIFLAVCSGARMEADIVQLHLLTSGPGGEALLFNTFSVSTTEIRDWRSFFVVPNRFDSFECSINAWFGLCAQHQIVVDLSYEALCEKTSFLHIQALSLYQALEAFHRAIYNTKYTTDEKYEEIRSQIVNAIPENLESSHRSSLKSRIKYGNEVSLDRRLRELAKTIPCELRNVILPDGKVPRSWVDTRNYYTHWDMEAKSSVPEDETIYRDCIRIRMFLRVLLLRKISVCETNILECFDNVLCEVAEQFKFAARMQVE